MVQLSKNAQIWPVLEHVKHQISNLIAMQRILIKPMFAEIWRELSQDERDDVLGIIDNGSKADLVTWLKKHNKLQLGEMPVSDLKNLAKQARIKNWCRLPRLLLIRELEKLDAVYK